MGSVLVSGIITILREVRDPRQVNAQHNLGDILFVALACIVCGGKACVDMADFAKTRLSELREIIDLEFGAPSHDTFSRVFRLLDPQELSKAFGLCMETIGRELGLGGSPGVVAIDGKSLRRGYEAGRGGCHVAGSERAVSAPQELSGGCDRGAPRVHRRGAKRAVRLGRGEMALDVKGVVDGGTAEIPFADRPRLANLAESRGSSSPGKPGRFARTAWWS